MSEVWRHVGRAWRALERAAEERWFGVALSALALAEYAIVSIAFPLAAGRDLGTYLRAAFELRSSEVVLPQALLMRAPVTGVVAEALLEAGAFAAEAGMALAYALSIVCWWRVAARVSPTVGLVTAGLLLVFPGPVLLYHELASDAIYAAAFALAALLLARLVERPTAGRAAALGLGIALLVLVRPVSQVLVLLVPLVLLLPGAWGVRLGRATALALAAAIPLVGWAVHNAVRADDFTLVRGAGHGLPLYRAFVVDRIVEPGNGDASRGLARAVQRDLLPREPYRSYGVSLEEFFDSGSARMHEDLIGLADRTWGWDDDYRHLARVGREAVLAHPSTYARGVARDTWRLLWWPLFLPVKETSETSSTAGRKQSAPRAGRTELPVPSEGQPIPAASVSSFVSTPDERFREVWTSPSSHEILAEDPRDAAHLDRSNVRVNELYAAFTERGGDAGLGSWLNRASRWFPRPIVWLVATLVAAILRRPRGLAVPGMLAAAALLLLVATVLAVPATAEYTVPVAPSFILLAVAALLGPRSAPRRGRSST